MLTAAWWLRLVSAEKEDLVPPLQHVRDCRVGLGECKEGEEYLSLPQLQELRRELQFVLVDGADQCIFPP